MKTSKMLDGYPQRSAGFGWGRARFMYFLRILYSYRQMYRSIN
jgi:hypothetical protein